MRVADYLIKFLQERGVDHAFLVAGGQMMYLMDAVKQAGMKYTCFHHEQAAAYAADAYARVTGRPSLCLATGGPGGPNLMTGIVGAFQDSVPIIFLVGQSKVKDMSFGTKLRQKGFLEVDTLRMMRHYTKCSDVIDHPHDAPSIMRMAWHHCQEDRPGPVYIEVPLDVQEAEVSFDTNYGVYRASLECHPDDYRTVVDALRQSERPVLLLGRGVEVAGVDVDAFIRALDIPVLTTQFAKSLVWHGEPLFMGHPGVKGDTAANLILSQADFVLVLGCSLHNQTVGWDGEYLSKDAKIFHVDPDRAVLNKTGGTTKIVSDVDRFVVGLMPLIEPTHQMQWKTICHYAKDAHANEYRKWEPSSDLDLYQVLTELDAILPDDAIILYDAGQPYYAIPQVLRKRGTQRFIAPGSLAQMGWALPAAIGASKATDRPIYAIIGDGSLMTNVQELATLALHVGNVKIIVIDNDGYASIRKTQERYCGGRDIGSSFEDVHIPDIEGLANAMGVDSNTIGIEDPLKGVIEGSRLTVVKCRLDQSILVPKPLPAPRTIRHGEFQEDQVC